MSASPRTGYLLKKFPRLSETFVLGEILGQEALGADLTVFSRRTPDDEPRHPMLADLRAPVEVLPSSSGMAPWLELFEADPVVPDLPERMGRMVRAFADVNHARLPALFAEALWLLRRTRELDIEHLHVHFATDSAVTAMILHGLGGPTYSITAHAKDIYRTTVDAALLERLVAGSAFTVTVCDANVRHLEGLLSDAAMAHVHRIYNGIDLGDFRADDRREEEHHVLAAGRLVEKKGFHVLLDALALLQERGVPFTATIIGEGEARAELEAQRARLGLAESVALTGALDQGQVRDHMRRATVFCLPCIVGADGNRDALPTVLIEALACGLPVVSTPVTGIPEILAHGRAGRLVPEHSAAATADALEGLLADDRARAELAATGLEHARQQFDRGAAARRLAERFEAALAVGVPAERS